jgi:hypothetical protein
MSYIGNTPAENYASFLTETFSVSATANYTLSHAVSNENDIRLVINNVVQQPGSGKAYTASGTTLTLTSATSSGDVMYAVYLGRALQTVNPPNASVGSDQTAPTIITGQTAETSIATDDTILIHDTSASALRKMTRANFVSGIGGVNTPAFSAERSSDQTITNNTRTTVLFNNEFYDSSNAYDTSTGKFTPQVAGKYYVTANCQLTGDNYSNLNLGFIELYKNSSVISEGVFDMRDNPPRSVTPSVIIITDMNGSSDFLLVQAYIKNSSGGTLAVRDMSTFQAFRIIE